MLGQIVSLFVVVAVTTAYPAISHQSRVDGLRLGYTDHAVSHYNYVNFPDHFHHYPHYKFSYSVFDPHTGDHKSQAEYRRGGLVKGSYSLAEPGGNMRSVLYSADDIHGFNAIVHHNTVHHYVPHHHHHY